MQGVGALKTSGALMWVSQEEMVFTSPQGLFPEARHSRQWDFKVSGLLSLLWRGPDGSDRLVQAKQMLSTSSCGVPWGGLPAVLGRAGQSLASLPSEGPLCQSLPTRLHPTIRQGWQW